MELTSFSLEIKNHVAHLNFNRPEKSNSLHKEAWVEMKQVFEQLDEDPEVRCIILGGEGKNFCAGIDLSLLMDVSQYDNIDCEGRKRELLRKFIYNLQDSITAIEKCRKPVLGAIHRACIGGGVDIIAACDIRYCTEDAYFSIKEVDMGLIADIGTLQRLPKIINQGVVSELAFTGRKLFGPEAKEVSLVNQVYPDKESLISAVTEIAETIAVKSPLVIRGTKEIIQYTRDHSVEESLKYMGTFNAAFLLTNDLKACFRAQMTKTAPQFEG